MASADYGNSQQRSRYQRNPDGLAPIHLVARDLEILRAVGDYQILSTSQVAALFFQSHHRARKRLWLLWQYGYLNRILLPVRFGAGSEELLYELSRQGRAFLASRSDKPSRESGPSTRSKSVSNWQLEHLRMRNDFRVALTLACRLPDGPKLLFWKQGQSIAAEVRFANAVSPGAMGRVPLIADGFFGLRLAGNDRFFFVEIDRGTAGLKRIAQKMLGYSNWFLQKGHVRRFGIPGYQVLWVASTAQREANLSKAAESLGMRPLISALFSVTNADHYRGYTPNLLSNSIWSPPHNGQSKGSRLLAIPPPMSGFLKSVSSLSNRNLSHDSVV